MMTIDKKTVFDTVDKITLEEKQDGTGLRIKINGGLVDIFEVILANAAFSEFKVSLKNKEYEKVYTSEVFKAINELCTDENLVNLAAGTTVLRARVISDENDIYQEKKGIHFDGDVLRGYDWYNSKEPAVGISSEGRANSKYSSYFYCAGDGPTAASEIKPNIGDYISLARFTIKRELKLIKLESKDLFDGQTKEECILNIIANQFSVPISDSNEYYLTQFISDEIRKYGVDGICYRSHFTNKNNYVIFNCSMDTIEFVRSKIIQLHSHQLNFVDFSSSKMISAKAIPDLNENEIRRERSYLNGMIQAYKYESSKEQECNDGEDEDDGQDENVLEE